MSVSSDTAIQEFVERMGLSAQADGLPRIAGRMMGLFIIFGGPLSFSELAERLDVSRGSVSTNARLLTGLGVIERVARAGDRQDFYQLASDPYGQLLRGYVERMQRVDSAIRELRAALPASQRDAHGRLGEMQTFYRAAIDNTRTLIERLGGGRARRPANEPSE